MTDCTNLPSVIVYDPPEKRQPRQCLCVECGALRPSFYIPNRWVASGLLPVLMFAAAQRAGKQLPQAVSIWRR